MIYDNKMMEVKIRNANICPVCSKGDWRKVVEGSRKRIICKGCGHVQGK